ncbi:MAG: alpha/beta hydrolase family protein [Candidatus Cryptobacteroides sp.]
MRKRTAMLLMIFIPAFMAAQNPFTGSWNGKLNVGQASLTVVFNISSGNDGNLECTMDSPDQGAAGIKADASVKNAAALEITVPNLGVTYKGMLINGSIIGTFSQMGKNFPLTLSKRKEVLKRHQNPEGPFPYSEEEVTFTNIAAGAVLAGTLVIPDNATPATPVVLMVTGSGLEDRNEEIFDHKPFMVIADYLARNGIASLRYDDRTFGKSTGGNVKEATTLDFLDDAAAGIEYLRASGRFGKTGVLGHSEGGNIAIMLGARKKVDFVISLAGVGVRGDEAFTAQANRIMELQGIDQRYTVQAFRATVLAQGNPWMGWFINYDPSEDVKACACPVFAANGDKDIQVISSINLAGIRENLPDNPANLIREYPSLNHLFQHCETGDVLEYRKIEETFSPGALNDLVIWIKGLGL